MTKILLAILTTSVALCDFANAAAVVTVAVSTDGRSLQNAAGLPLSGGNASVNGDGVSVQIGYYQGATANTIFFGTDESSFVSLIGAGSVLGLNLTVGDAAANFTGNGEIFADIDVVGSNAVYPAAGVPLVMRFFSATSLSGSSTFEAVSNLSWKWVNPVELPSIARVEMNFDIPGMVAKSGANISSNGSSIRASSPNPLAVPEPSSLMLLSIGALVSLRRRRS